MDSKTEARVMHELHRLATDMKYFFGELDMLKSAGNDVVTLNKRVEFTIKNKPCLIVIDGFIGADVRTDGGYLYLPNGLHSEVNVTVEGIDEINDNPMLDLFFGYVLVNNLAKELGMEVV
jgi:hypothetical protein